MVSSVLRQGLFNGKVAIVTGGGTGIGLAITKELVYLGAKVVIAARNEDRLRQVADQLNNDKSLGHANHVHAIACNIRKEDQVKNLFKETLAKLGRVDFLVNNGGGQFACPAENISLNGWKAVVETNLNGTFFMCREALHSWMKDHGGSIVNIIVGMRNGFPMMAHSGAARAGIENLTKSLALEWAPYKIRMNSIAPGTIWSETAAANYPDPEMFRKAIPFIPARRLGTTEEISGMICFLFSPAASFITGTTIPIDGGEKIFGHAPLALRTVDYEPTPIYKWEETSDPPGYKSRL